MSSHSDITLVENNRYEQLKERSSATYLPQVKVQLTSVVCLYTPPRMNHVKCSCYNVAEMEKTI